MKENLIKFLMDMGLSEQRARLYLIALSMGKATVSELAKATNIRRTAMYDNLDALQGKGLVRVIHEGKRKIYIPKHPREFYRQVSNQKEQFRDLLPDFIALFAQTTREPFVQVFTGTHAAREVYEDILRVAPKEYMYFSAPSLAWLMTDKTFMRSWVDRRVAKKIHVRTLRVRGKDVSHVSWLNESDAFLRHIRYLPEYVDLKNSIYMYGNNIGIISTVEENAAYIIYSPDFAYSLKQIFEFLWNISVRR